ncbi:hypothetical protein HN958_01060, partial [Candidatus Falkowbacteria bacterium]|nr:hypothetical protein [Candidatus Falkowbacteria bacterium]
RIEPHGFKNSNIYDFDSVDKLFNTFVENLNKLQNKKEQNRGMGLYITQNHVFSMGGNIQFKTNGGTTFEIIIPTLST